MAIGYGKKVFLYIPNPIFDDQHVFGIPRQIPIYLILPPPKPSHFVSAVLRTHDFVGIAPGKVNTHFVRASFSFERDKFKFKNMLSAISRMYWNGFWANRKN